MEFIGRPNLPEGLAAKRLDINNAGLTPNEAWLRGLQSIIQQVGHEFAEQKARRQDAQKTLLDLIGKGQILTPGAGGKDKPKAQPIMPGLPAQGESTDQPPIDLSALTGAAPKIAGVGMGDIPVGPTSSARPKAQPQVSPETATPPAIPGMESGDEGLPNVLDMFPNLRGYVASNAKFKSYKQLKEEMDFGQAQVFVDPATIELFNPASSKTADNPKGLGIDLSPFLGQYVDRKMIQTMYAANVRNHAAEAQLRLREEAMLRNGRVMGSSLNRVLGVDLYPAGESFPGATMTQVLKIAEARAFYDAKIKKEMEPVEGMLATHQHAMKLATEAGGGHGRLFGPLVGGLAKMGFNPSVMVWDQFREAMLSNYSRILGGERGVLTDQDVERIRGIQLSKSDTQDEFERKSKLIVDIIEDRKRIIAGQKPGGILSNISTGGVTSDVTLEDERKKVWDEIASKNPTWSPKLVAQEVKKRMVGKKNGR